MVLEESLLVALASVATIVMLYSWAHLAYYKAVTPTLWTTPKNSHDR